MRGRTIYLSLPIIAATFACGCGSQHTYNVPVDESKDIAAIKDEKGDLEREKAAARKKPNKPPVSLKGAGGIQPTKKS